MRDVHYMESSYGWKYQKRMMKQSICLSVYLWSDRESIYQRAMGVDRAMYCGRLPRVGLEELRTFETMRLSYVAVTQKLIRYAVLSHGML